MRSDERLIWQSFLRSGRQGVAARIDQIDNLKTCMPCKLFNANGLRLRMCSKMTFTVGSAPQLH